MDIDYMQIIYYLYKSSQGVQRDVNIYLLRLLMDSYSHTALYIKG